MRKQGNGGLVASGVERESKCIFGNLDWIIKESGNHARYV